jgi:hypothetical protein
MEEIFVTTKADEFVPNTRWIASLSNGETIFEDNRANLDSAWRRLSKYIKEKDLKITQLRFQHNGKTVTMPSHADGYFHLNKVFEGPGNVGGKFFRGIGVVNNNITTITWIDIKTGDQSVEQRGVKEGPCILNI